MKLLKMSIHKELGSRVKEDRLLLTFVVRMQNGKEKEKREIRRKKNMRNGAFFMRKKKRKYHALK